MFCKKITLDLLFVKVLRATRHVFYCGEETTASVFALFSSHRHTAHVLRRPWSQSNVAMDSVVQQHARAHIHVSISTSLILSSFVSMFVVFVVYRRYYYYFVSARGGKVWWKKYLTMAQIVQFWINIGGLLLWLYFDYITPGGCAGVCISLFCDIIVLKFVYQFRRRSMGFLCLHESFYSFICVVSTILFENVQKCRRRQEKESKIKKKKFFKKTIFVH